MTARALAPCCLVLLAACNGKIDDSDSTALGAGGPGMSGGSGALPANAGAGANSGTGGSGAQPPGTGGASSCGRALIEPRAVLLTPSQYLHSLQDLLGKDAVSEDDLAVAGDPEIEVIDRPWVTTSTLDRTLRDAEAATESLRGHTTTFTGCDALTDTTCVRNALAKLARRAWKRAPESDELDGLMALYDEALTALPQDGGESATLTAMQGVLTAPSMLYRTEFSGTKDGTTVGLSGDERAAAIAGLLLDSIPDDELLAAADDGSLITDAGLQAQLTRLLALPRVRDHLTNLVMSAYRASRVFGSPKDEMVFPEFSGALQNSMYEESRRFIDDVFWTRDASVNELMTSRTTFADDAIAKLYGITRPSGTPDDEFVSVALPDGRAGLLTQPSVLSVLARTDKTSVVARGLFVRGALLCLPKIPGPPAAVQTQVMMQLAQNATQPELAAYRAKTSPCMGCHSQFDRFGLSLEGFDAIGKERDPKPDPIDLTGLGTFSQTISSAQDLVGLMVEDNRFARCMSERLLDYSLSTVQGGDAYCDADPLHAAFVQGAPTIEGLVAAVVSHPAFMNRTEMQ